MVAESNGNSAQQEGGYVPKSILITGGAGFIGSHVIKRLIKHHPEYKVIVGLTATVKLAA